MTKKSTPRLDRWIKQIGNTPKIVGLIHHRLPGKRARRRYNLVTKTINGVRVTLQERAMKSLLEVERDLAAKGKGLQVVSSYRSWAKQAALYAAWIARGMTGLPAAKPGTSNHNRGTAVDLGNDEDHDVQKAMAHHGWKRGTAFGDPVHFDAA